VVRMGRLSAGHAGAWRADAQRSMVVWPGGGADPRPLSEASVSASALHLLERVPELPNRRAVHAGTLHGFSGRSQGGGHPGRVHVWAGLPGRTGDRTGRDPAGGVPAGGMRLVQLLDLSLIHI